MVLRWADYLRIDYHQGCGRPVRWSQSEQRDLSLMQKVLAAGFVPETAAELVRAIPVEWEYGWAVIHAETRFVVHASLPEDIPDAVVDEFPTVIVPLGSPWVVDVDTGGRV